MSDQQDFRVSPTLNPDTVKGVEGYNDETAPFVADVVSAFTHAFVAIAKIHDARALADRNPAFTDEQRILVVGREAQIVQQKLLARMDAASASVQKHIDLAERELSKPLTESGQSGINAEVRLHFKGLKPDARAKLINAAFAGDDDKTLGALLAAPPFLSGMSPEESAHYINRYHSQKNPHLVARLGVLRGAMAKLDRDATRVMVEVEKAVGAPLTRVNSIDGANSRALSALAALKTSA